MRLRCPATGSAYSRQAPTGRLPAVVGLLGMVVLAAAGCGTASNLDAEKLAVESAAEWLELVDAGDYGESWQEAAAYFKAAVTREGWEQAVSGVRTPLGAVVSRKVRSKTHETSLPGAPDGEYVVIQYDTAFENKRSAVETVTPMLDRDGTWRVSGYYVN